MQRHESGDSEPSFVDPWMEKVNRYKEVGYSQQQILMALTAVETGSDDEVVQIPKFPLLDKGQF